MLSIGDQFPQFVLTACVSRHPHSAFRTVRSSDYDGKWLVCFFWPKAFTPVCATEIHDFGTLGPDFEEREAAVLGIGVESEFVYLAWTRQGPGPDDLPFPLLSDSRRRLVDAVGVLDQRDGVANRATFIVDPGLTIRHVSVNDFSVGRNPREVLRILDALQTDALCPSSWVKGQPTIASGVIFSERLSLGAQQ